MDRGALLTGAGVGALLTFALDPDRGARRRALARDKLIWAARKTRDGVDATARDIANRTQGIAAASRARLRGEQVEDVRLVERVRSRLGRACSHPRAIDVEAHDGEVTLRGPILAHEVNDLLAVTAAVRGVKAVVSELEPHESANGIPSLQGDGHVAGPNIDILQRRWAPATRALVGVAALAATGVCMASYARRPRNVA